jgi:hypothetical protein
VMAYGSQNVTSKLGRALAFQHFSEQELQPAAGKAVPRLATTDPAQKDSADLPVPMLTLLTFRQRRAASRLTAETLLLLSEPLDLGPELLEKFDPNRLLNVATRAVVRMQFPRD